jgi:Fur family transcriptional regulator, ferric uptake regulator
MQERMIAMTHDETFLHALRQRGIRITPQREMIIDALAHGECHMTADEIYEQVSEHTHVMNITTVYRTLDLMVEAGLVSRANLSDGRMTYATSQHGPHLHLVCRLCGYTADADSELLATFVEQVKSQYHFWADWQHLSIQGTCQACQDKIVLQEE